MQSGKQFSHDTAQMNNSPLPNFTYSQVKKDAHRAWRQAVESVYKGMNMPRVGSTPRTPGRQLLASGQSVGLGRENKVVDAKRPKDALEV